jgi:hypothetical protein
VEDGVEGNRFFNLILVFIVVHRNCFNSLIHDLDALVIVVEQLSKVLGVSVVRERYPFECDLKRVVSLSA